MPLGHTGSILIHTYQSVDEQVSECSNVELISLEFPYATDLSSLKEGKGSYHDYGNYTERSKMANIDNQSISTSDVALDEISSTSGRTALS